MSENPYAPPGTPLRDPQDAGDGKPGIAARFLWATACAVPVFVGLIVLFLPRKDWPAGLLGSAMFSMLAGIVAMCIPVRPKVGFIVPGVVVSFFVAWLIGTRGG